MRMRRLGGSRGGGLRRGAGGQRGFSLIELMIASVLAIMISAMMFTVLTSQEKSSSQTESNAQMQEQLRFALQTMARQVRMAGYGVGPLVVGSQAFNNVQSIVASDNLGNYGGRDATGSEIAGSDQLLVIYRNPAQEFILDWETYQKYQYPCSTNALVTAKTVLLEPVTLNKDDTIVCMDESAVGPTMFLAWTVSAPSVTGGITSPGATVLVTPNTTQPFTDRCTKNVPTHMTCGSIVGSTVGFYLDNETLWMDDDGDSLVDPGTGQLAQADPTNTDDIPIARGIEDLQLAFCIPGYPNTITMSEADRGAAFAQCMTNPGSYFWRPPTDILPASGLLPYARAVRITLVAKGQLDPSRRLLVSRRPRVENHTPADTTDGTTPASTRYPRMIESTIVQLPNLRYLQGYGQEFLK